MRKDIRYAIRSLRRSPAFALTAIVSIALGIGPNSAIFSFQDGLLLRPLAVEKPDQVVSITSRLPNGSVQGFTYPDFLELREKNRSFEGLFGYALVGTSFARDEKTQLEFRSGFLVTGNFFTLLGVKPALGRGFRADEDEVPGRDAVVVLSHDFWKNAFGSDPSIVGRHIRFGRGGAMDFTVIGVAPKSFTGMDQFLQPDFYVPSMMGPKMTGVADLLTSRNYSGNGYILGVKGRLKSGVSIEAANADIAALAQGLERDHPESNRDRRGLVRTEIQIRLDNAPILGGIVAAVFALMIVILAIACANVTNLMLSRARAQSRDISVRLAIGASRPRLIRQLMAESLVISVAGGALGLLIAQAAVQLFSRFEVPGDVPVRLSFELDSRVLWFTLLISVTSAILFGLVPALHSTRTDLVTTLKAGELSHSRKRFFLRNVLVTVQIAGSLVMLMTAAQMYRNIEKTLRDNPGFTKDHRLAIRLDPSLGSYTKAQTEQFYRTLTERTRGLSGVRSAALSAAVPLTTQGVRITVAPEGYEFPAGQQNLSIGASIVDEAYFATLNVPILVGRGFEPLDQDNSPRVAIVNQEFARRFFDGNAVGRRIRLDDSKGEWAEIVGMTTTGKYFAMNESSTPFVYLPFRQNFQQRMTLFVETSADPLALAGPLRTLIASIDPNMPVISVRTIDDIFEHGTATQLRIFSTVFSAASVMGFILAVVGIYAVVAFQVTRRTREIGVRMALGARRVQVLGLILRQAGLVGGIGITIGLFLSVVARPALMVSMGRPVSPFDPIMIAVIPLSLLAVTIAAAAIPARRAAQIDPQNALRQN